MCVIIAGARGDYNRPRGQREGRARFEFIKIYINVFRGDTHPEASRRPLKQKRCFILVGWGGASRGEAEEMSRKCESPSHLSICTNTRTLNRVLVFDAARRGARRGKVRAMARCDQLPNGRATLKYSKKM